LKKHELIARPQLGKGIYSLPDIAMLLGIPNYKVNRWIRTFWDGNLGAEFNSQYSWNVDLTKAVNFHTLVEIYLFYQLSQAGVNSVKILEAHKILSAQYRTPYPFAQKNIITKIRTEGTRVLFEYKDGEIYTLDAKRQFKLGFIRDFFKNLDFDGGNLAVRLWPLGKSKAIVCDPDHQFGQPVIPGTNILAETISDLHQAGDSVTFISKTYNISRKQVDDAIEYGRKAA
jgi:uncharacterized protein (DUF433 family)